MTIDDPSPGAARLALRKRQAQLARAMLLADRGDVGGALALAREVLDEDPQSAPARALLGRLAGKSTAPAGSREDHQAAVSKRASAAPHAPTAPPPATAVARATSAPSPSAAEASVPRRSDRGSWAQFEQRMRLRREATCATAMRQAMDAGDHGTALARARELAEIDPAWNEVRLLLETEARVATGAQGVDRRTLNNSPHTDDRVYAGATPEIPRAPRSAVGRPLRLTLTLVLLLASVGAAGWLTVLVFRPNAVAGGTQRSTTAPQAEVEVPNLPPIGSPLLTAESAAQSAGTPAAAPAGTAVPPAQARSGGSADKQKSITNDRTRETVNPGTSPPSPVISGAPVAPPLSQQYVQPPPPATRLPSPPSPSSQGATQALASPTGAASAGTGAASIGTSGTSDGATRVPAIRVENGPGALQPLTLPPAQPETPPPSNPTAAERQSLAAVPSLRDTSSEGTARPPASAPADARPPSTTMTTPSTATATAEQTDDSRAVSSTLAAYQQGYTSLDARAVSRVWPRVDAQALQSAFAQLDSQRVTFSLCSIDVRGLHASAICRGSAVYVPKVGNGEPVRMQRTWQFALRKFGESWVIDSATTR